MRLGIGWWTRSLLLFGGGGSAGAPAFIRQEMPDYPL